MAIKLKDKLTGIFSIFDYVGLREGVELEELAQAFEMKPVELRQLLIDLTMIDIPEIDYDAVPRLDIDLLNEEGIVDFFEVPAFDKILEFTQFEAYALVVGLSLLEPQLRPTDRVLSKALKLKLINHYKLNASVDSMQVVSAEDTHDYCQQLLDAINSHQSVWIEYLSLQQVCSQREILPLEITRTGEHLRLKAYCFKVEETRHFRIDRILSLQAGKPAEVPVMKQNRKRNLRVSLQLEQVPEGLKEAAVELKEMKNGTKITLQIFEQSWLQTQLLLHADLLQAVNDAEALHATRQKAKSLNEMYELLSAKNRVML